MYELDAIAATVIGGTSLLGGEGGVAGTLIGALIMAVLRNGLNLLGVSSFLQQVVIDRKSTRLNSSHVSISYAVFCLKKKKIHTPTAISIFVCLSMVKLMAVFISMRCTLCGHFLQVALTLILFVEYAIAAS